MGSYEIMICPLKFLYQYAADGDMSNVAVLAVSSYDIDEEKLNGFRSTLFLNFADVICSTDPSAFSKTTAERIAEYIKGLPTELDSLFICCDSGESRSTAIAAAIMRYNGFQEMDIWTNPHYHPNRLVYKLLCDALGLRVTDKEIDERISINNKALTDAING